MGTLCLVHPGNRLTINVDVVYVLRASAGRELGGADTSAERVRWEVRQQRHLPPPGDAIQTLPRSAVLLVSVAWFPFPAALLPALLYRFFLLFWAIFFLPCYLACW